MIKLNTWFYLALLLISSCKNITLNKSSTPGENATCSTSAADPLVMSTNVSRTDNALFPTNPLDFAAYFALDRSVASLKDELAENSTFTTNHSVIPSPLYDSDGRYADGVSGAKIHYLETLAVNEPGKPTRASMVTCGATGTIEARIADCAALNGLWAFYDGDKYGQTGEGDWKLVTLVVDGSNYEVWRDERTKLLWSDKAANSYTWFHASGYAKDAVTSVADTTYDASPGGLYQPASPISVCPDVIAGEIVGGGGVYINYQANPETSFKGNLSYPQVTWRLPSKNDFQLADVNGIRKAIPNMEGWNYLTSTTVSLDRQLAWFFLSDDGMVSDMTRTSTDTIRCVGSWRD